MEKTKTFTGILKHYERRNNSYCGNPKYFGVFENENGKILAATTATNASCDYGFLNQRDALRTIEYHTSKTGKNIIDYITI